MIFHRLKLRNFGVYAGEHEIELAPKKKGSPVILFGGLNGRGKTTLLDAIQLLFFGKLNLRLIGHRISGFLLLYFFLTFF